MKTIYKNENGKTEKIAKPFNQSIKVICNTRSIVYREMKADE